MRIHSSPLLIVLLLIALAGFGFGLVLPQLQSFRVSAPLHLVFALGIMPLILGVMTYFVPVLTRTRAGGPQALIPAGLALLSGILISFSLFFRFAYFPLAALIGLAAVIWLMLWIRSRAREMLGKPHPGLLWYQLALAALLLGLLSILAGYLLPEQWANLRRFHLHLNTLGFIGFTALGTLRVLLPTAGRYADPQAGEWLRRQWPWLLTGTLLVSIGAAWLPLLALLGLLLWLKPLIPLIHDPLFRQRAAIWRAHGATTSLASAILGLLILLLSGLGHGFGALSPNATAQAFIPLFLLPLVSGAASHLLPLWITSPQEGEAQQRLRIILGSYAAWRAALFLIGGSLLLAGQTWGLLLILFALLQFLVAVAIVLIKRQ